MPSILRTAALLGASLTLMACTSTTPKAHQPEPGANPASALTGRWQITRIAGQPVNASQHTVLEFDASAHAYSATAGCNRIFGRYEVSQGRLRLSPPGSTLKACPPAQQALETALAQTLQAISNGRYHVSQDQLEIHTPAGAVALQGQR